MELRMQPRTEGPQRCLSFRVSSKPRANVFAYADYLGNTVQYFDVPEAHRDLAVVAEAQVECLESPDAPPGLPQDAWREVDAMAAAEDYWEVLSPSHFVPLDGTLDDLARDLGAERRGDPMTVLRDINAGLFGWMAYVPRTTRVDSPIRDALRARAGVCQDYAHIMTGLARRLGIPCRYVSGYLFHGASDRSAEGATHAWVEALLPGLDWVGFDPANNVMAGMRHIRTAIGRDYADVPPTRGIFKGMAESELTVSVRVTPAGAVPQTEEQETAPEPFRAPARRTADVRRQMQQQQQQ